MPHWPWTDAEALGLREHVKVMIIRIPFEEEPVFSDNWKQMKEIWSLLLDDMNINNQAY